MLFKHCSCAKTFPPTNIFAVHLMAGTFFVKEFLPRKLPNNVILYGCNDNDTTTIPWGTNFVGS
jgi:hypothetical protein